MKKIFLMTLLAFAAVSVSFGNYGNCTDQEEFEVKRGCLKKCGYTAKGNCVDDCVDKLCGIK